jgi:hypothetical protein
VNVPDPNFREDIFREFVEIWLVSSWEKHLPNPGTMCGQYHGLHPTDR